MIKWMEIRVRYTRTQSKYYFLKVKRKISFRVCLDDIKGRGLSGGKWAIVP